MLTNSRTILVTGGAGFIGSHMVLTLQNAGFHVLVLDDLSHGHRDVVFNADFIHGNVCDRLLLNKIFSAHEIFAVIHFAACIEVNESIKDPLKYYQNNVYGSMNLLSAMIKHGVKNLVFSSTAAVYGEPHNTPIDENHPLNPINPYGKSKLMVETMIQDAAKSYALNYTILRYFNAAGCDHLARIGERHTPETHLIPLVLQTAMGLKSAITIYGNDYQTVDGTCIRDYVHVTDLCDAHLLALQKITEDDMSFICNLGSGKGASVKNVIDAAEKVTGKLIKTITAERRLGDPAILVADISFAQQILQFKPKYSTLEMILNSAWQFLLKTNAIQLA